MFTIKRENLAVFEQGALETFKKGLGIVIGELSPTFGKLGGKALDELLNRIIREAESFGFLTRREVAYYAILVAQHGERFYDRPRFVGAKRWLQNSELHPLQRLGILKTFLDSGGEELT